MPALTQEEEVEENGISQLIENLDCERQDDETGSDATRTAYTVFATEEELRQTAAAPQKPTPPELAAAAAVGEQFVDDEAECAKAALHAVTDIIGDLGAIEDDGMEATEADDAQKVKKAEGNSGHEAEPKLFPIFYKSAGVQGGGDASASSTTTAARPLTGIG